MPKSNRIDTRSTSHISTSDQMLLVPLFSFSSAQTSHQITHHMWNKLRKVLKRATNFRRSSVKSHTTEATVEEVSLPSERQRRIDLVKFLYSDMINHGSRCVDHFGKGGLYCLVNQDGEVMEMPVAEYGSEVDKFYRSFPDAEVFPTNFQTTLNTVSMDITAMGTHTGEPFGFGPFEAIPATHKRVEHPVTQICVTFGNDNKISRIVATNTDDTCGPAYYYEQIGGMLI